MNFDPFLNAPFYLQLHAICALISLAIGPIALYRKRRDVIHKMMGYVWMTTMATTALSSFWIREINADGSLSPVHFLAVFALGTIVWSIWSVRRGNIKAHRRSLKNLYYYGTFGAFTINFLPNRTIPNMIFDGGSMASFVTAATIIATLVFGVQTLERARRIIV